VNARLNTTFALTVVRRAARSVAVIAKQSDTVHASAKNKLGLCTSTTAGSVPFAGKGEEPSSVAGVRKSGIVLRSARSEAGSITVLRVTSEKLKCIIQHSRVLCILYY
jgi:hypothetical protein